MNRAKVLKTLIFSYFLLFIALSSWGIVAWRSSSPNIYIAQVKGASSEEGVLSKQNSTLSQYPVLSEKNFPSINAREYALYNPESGKTLLQSTSSTPVATASTTKLMTAHLLTKIDRVDLNEVVTISEYSSKQPADSSLMGLRMGEHITIKNLLYGALLVSGNDAADALAEYGGGILLNNSKAPSEEKIKRFVQEMNTEAIRLGMNNTSYKDPVGYDDLGRSTAVDIAKLMGVSAQNVTLEEIMSTDKKQIFSSDGAFQYTLKNSNRLVTDYSYPGIIGGKTGFTYEAGHCLVTAAKRKNTTLVAVILNTDSNTSEASAIENKKLLDAGFSLIRWQ